MNQDLFQVQSTSDITLLASTVTATLFLLTASLIFVIIVFFDQIVIITNRLSVLDRVRLYANKLGKRVRKRAKKNFEFTFGEPFCFRWFLPLPPKQKFEVEGLY